MKKHLIYIKNELFSLKSSVLGKNFFWLTTAEASNAIALYIVNILVGRHYSIKDFGDFVFFFAFITTFGGFLDIGVSTIYLRDSSADPKRIKEFISNLFTFKILLAILTVLLVLVTTIVFKFSNTLILLILFAMIYYIIDSFNTFLKIAFKSTQTMHYESISRIIEKVALVLFVIFLIINKFDIKSIYFSYIMAALISLGITIFILLKKYDILLNKSLFKFKTKFILPILKESWPFFFNSIFCIIYYRIDSTMLEVMKGEEAVAKYGVAYSLFSTVNSIPGIVGIVIFPYMSNIFSKSKKSLYIFMRKSYFYLLLISIFSTIFMIIGSNFIILISFTKKYSASIHTLQILSLSFLFVFLSTIFLYFLITVKQQTKTVYIILSGAIINILLNLYLIPKFSYNGSAVATVITEGVVLLLYYFTYLNARSKIRIS